MPWMPDYSAPGNYVYNASVIRKQANKQYPVSSLCKKYSLKPIKATADHNYLLRLLSSQQGGVNVSPDNIFITPILSFRIKR